MLNTRKAFSYFNNRFGLKKSTNGWWSFDCPICIGRSSKKMAVNFNCEVVKCWKCGYKDTATEFIMQYEELDYWGAKKFINEFDESDIDTETLSNTSIAEVSDVVLPKGFVPIAEGEGTLGRRAREYLLDRGFNLKTLDRMGFGYCNEHDEEKNKDYFGRIIVPFKRNGKLCYFLGRDFIGDFMRYKNPPTEQFGIGKADILFNEDALFLCDTVVVTEGWADALTFGRSGVATMGWSMSKYQLGALNRGDCSKLVFVPDAGADNQGVRFFNHAVQTALSFIDTKEEVYVLDIEEAGLTEYGKDANEIGKKRILEAISNLQPLTFESAIKHIIT